MPRQRPFRNTPKYLKLSFWGECLSRLLHFLPHHSLCLKKKKLFYMSPMYWTCRRQVTHLRFCLFGSKHVGQRTCGCPTDDFLCPSVIPGQARAPESRTNCLLQQITIWSRRWGNTKVMATGRERAVRPAGGWFRVWHIERPSCEFREWSC